MFDRNSKILITGAKGLVGTALIEELESQGYRNLIKLTKESCDLICFDQTKAALFQARPDIVFHLAAAVFGIGECVKNQGLVFVDNVLINTHVIEASRLAGAKKIIAMGSVATYPEPKITPVKEEHLWNGPPHAADWSYAQAKRTMLAQLMAFQKQYGLDYAYVLSTNLYGKNDKFDIEKGHVIPSLIRKFYEAHKTQSEVIVWGDGTASRDFLYAKDLARILSLLIHRHSGPINVGYGQQKPIREVVGFLTDYFQLQGKVRWDHEKPNGRPFFDIDLSILKSLGFTPEYTLEKGLLETLDWFAL
ncbi:MAG: NAD-dependent epimerase/dehydratase family protein [Verrucomicrobia bacterium]|nr:NAD-dependent epimerase/dehydratase family protein [Verrucomicrobiota bacterium]